MPFEFVESVPILPVIYLLTILGAVLLLSQKLLIPLLGQSVSYKALQAFLSTVSTLSILISLEALRLAGMADDACRASDTHIDFFLDQLKAVGALTLRLQIKNTCN